MKSNDKNMKKIKNIKNSHIAINYVMRDTNIKNIRYNRL